MRGGLKFWKIFLFVLLGTFSLPKFSQANHCGREYACHQALLKFSRHAAPEQIGEIFSKNGLSFLQYYPQMRIYSVTLPSSEDTLRKISQLKRQEFILMAIPNLVVHADLLPNDPLFPNQWGLHNTGQSGGTVGADIGMEEAWNALTNATPIVVAVIDTGVDYTHPDLINNMWVNSGEIPNNQLDDDGNGYVDDVYGYDFYNGDSDPMDDYFHGTHVAGIVAAQGNNGLGVSGVAWSGRIMALKFMNENGSGLLSDAIEAIQYAVANGAKVMNNSWGTSFNSSSLENAIQGSDTAGLIFVAAAGNGPTNTDVTPFFPASYDVPNILSVAATTRYDALADYSNYGKITVDLGAPGSSIFSTAPTWYIPDENDYIYLSGTSMSSPHVAGAAALLWAAFPTLSHRQVMDFLLLGVTPKSYLADITVSGGMLNAAQSFQLAGDAFNHPPTANAGPDQFHKVGETVVLQGSGTDEDGNGALSFEWTLSTPQGSFSELDNPFSPTPRFIPDTEGTYHATLVVSDPYRSSVPDSITIEVSGNILPPPNVSLRAQKLDESGKEVDLSTGTVVQTGEVVTLDASGTTATFPKKLLFAWQWIATPVGSQTQLQNADQAITSFIPDLPGTYTVLLTAEDGFHESTGEISVVAVKASSSGPENGGEKDGAPASGGCSLSLPHRDKEFIQIKSNGGRGKNPLGLLGEEFFIEITLGNMR